MKLLVEGMTCGHCVRAVTRSLELDAAAKVNVDLGTREVSVAGDIELAAAVKAIQDEGYRDRPRCGHDVAVLTGA